MGIKEKSNFLADSWTNIYKFNPIPRWGGGGEVNNSFFFLNNFFAKIGSISKFLTF